MLYASLLLNVVAASGNNPCVVAFDADQFHESWAVKHTCSWGFFNWYYFCNSVSMLLDVTHAPTSVISGQGSDGSARGSLGYRLERGLGGRGVLTGHHPPPPVDLCSTAAIAWPLHEPNAAKGGRAPLPP
jgi:hypothetical protein